MAVQADYDLALGVPDTWQASWGVLSGFHRFRFQVGGSILKVVGEPVTLPSTTNLTTGGWLRTLSILVQPGKHRMWQSAKAGTPFSVRSLKVSSLLYDSRVLRKVQHDPTIQQAKRILTRPVSQKTQGHVFLGWHEKITVPPTSLPVTCHNISEKPTDPQVLAIPEPHRNPSLWV